MVLYSVATKKNTSGGIRVGSCLVFCGSINLHEPFSKVFKENFYVSYGVTHFLYHSSPINCPISIACLRKMYFFFFELFIFQVENIRTPSYIMKIFINNINN